MELSKTYQITNKNLIKVINKIQELKDTIDRFNENHQKRNYTIKIEQDEKTQLWNGEFVVNYEKAKKIRTFKKIVESYGTL